MHAEAFAFLRTVIGWLPGTSGLRVLEFGAHDVNGSPRSLFIPQHYPNIQYWGVDPWPGAGVDVVCRAQDFNGNEAFDVVISAETMEHDADWRGQIDAAWRALSPGGKFIMTAAAEPRKPHRCDGAEGDMQGEHYANIDPAELRRALAKWADYDVQHNRAHGDVYAWAVKP